MNFNEEYSKRKEFIENYLFNDFKNKNYPYKTIVEAMEYSVVCGGKRIRPVLMLSCYNLFKDNSEEILPFCAAMEYIHTYSLIHDDLPCMDNDDLRRGMPTSHIKFGEAIATLAGDALLNFAFEKALTCKLTNTLEALKCLAEASGKDGMIGGQVIDIENENKKIDIDLLKTLQALKTGALLSASCEIGAILGNASDSERELLKNFGLKLGLAFQIKDDILDVESSSEILGKPVGSDERNEKSTFVSFYGIEKCRELVTKLTYEAVSDLEIFHEKAEFLKELSMYLLSRDR